MLFFIRIATVIADLVAVIYSIVQLKRKKLPTYFKCALLGLISLLLASLYYLALSADPTFDNFFTIGIFGEVASYLFILTANMSLIPKEESEQRIGLSPIGFLCGGVAALLCILSVVLYPDLGNAVCAAIFALTISPCLYFTVKTLINPRKNPFKEGLRSYNLLMSVSLLCSAAAQFLISLAYAMQSEPIFLWGILFTNLPNAICCMLAMFALEKGLRPWEI